ncbi:MAG: hypothetical protein ACKOAR_10640, partial [Bacteroidota bacterium]
MKNYSWQKFAFRSIASILFVLAASAIWTACTEEASLKGPGDDAASASVKSTSKWGDYNVISEGSDDGTVWTYTITRATAKAKNLSHFIIDLQTCGDQSATFANIVSATLNGAPADLRPTEGWGTGCDPQASTFNFVKIQGSAATSWVIVITFDRGYAPAQTTGWLKAGTTCSINTLTDGIANINGPGCPLGDPCSYSQGFFFANGQANNGALAFWTNGLTIGGYTYVGAQGNQIWNTDRGRGGDQTLNAFFQLGAVRLSGVESNVQADADLIDKYFSLVGNSVLNPCGNKTCSNTPSTTCYGLVNVLEEGPTRNCRPIANPYSYINLPASVSYTVTDEFGNTSTVTIT